MQITWLGDAGIRIQIKDTVLLIDPPAASTGLKPTRQAANIVALTQKEHTDASSVNGDPFIITSPGEYERQGVFIYGIQLPGDADRTHFRIEAEELSLGHLGGIQEKLDDSQLTALEGVDVLFIPVGGKSVYTAEEAATLISQIEPRIVIPIQHQCPGSTAGYASVGLFLKEMGGSAAEPVDKIKITKKDLPSDETQIIVLTLS